MREVRTITTNKTDADSFMTDFNAALIKRMREANKGMVQGLMEDAFGKDSVEKIGDVHRRVDRVTTRKRTVSYSDGYWAKIEVKDNDHVSYKVFNSGWLAKTFNKIGFRTVLGNGWDSVKQRDTVEATLGATYMAIDESIAEDLRRVKHGTFLKEMIKTDPENLKAIAQLDMLDKGDGPGTEKDNSVGQVSAAQPGAVVSIPGYNSQNIAISNSGTYAKQDLTKPASIGMSSFPFSDKSTVLTFDNGEEATKVDPDGEVSFGDKMAKAIKEPVQETTTEKGEINVS